MRAALDAGDPRGALALLQRALADPVGQRPSIYALVERVAFALPQEALAVVREGRARFPEDASLRSLEVGLLRESGDEVEALAQMEGWIGSGDAPAEDVVAYAETLAMRGDLDAARAVLATLPDDSQSDLRLAQIELAGGRAGRAVEILEPALLAGSSDPWRLAVYGAALGRLGRVDEATAALNRAAGATQDSEQGSANSATALVAADYARRVLAVLGQQDRLMGGGRVALNATAGAAFEQGLYALEAGDMVAARDAFIRSREAQNEGFLAFFEGYTRQLLGDARGAIAAYNAARPALGSNAVLLNNLGFAQLQVGRYDLALEVLQEAVAVDSGNARALFNLGLTYYGLGRFTQAVRAFDAALAIDPSLERSASAAIEEARRRATP
jgi:tetratricopeptide (TPR) repeat protein